MSRGVVIFAFNNEQIDYLSMAAWSAKNIHRHLNLPVSVITDIKSIPCTYEFDQVIPVESLQTEQKRYFRDYKASGVWYNTNRASAHDLSPYEYTLVLDADFVVASDQLNCLFDQDQNFLSHRWAWDVTGHDSFRDNESFGAYKMPMSWATIVYFKKSTTAQLIFDHMNMIRNNWTHYREIYNIGEKIFRNDYALSIAQNTVHGHTLSAPSIPWKLATVTPETQLTQISADTYKIEYCTADLKPKWMLLQNQDFHAMGKQALGEIIANSR